MASGSPHRAKLLARLGLPFEARAPMVDEDAVKREVADPRELARTLARMKARKVLGERPEALVVGGDQVLELGGVALSKPGGRDAALERLRALSGRSHRLLTATCVAWGKEVRESLCEAELEMRPLTPREIELHLDREKAWDCPGGYRIEEGGIALFERVRTEDFTSIVGLPLIWLTTVLRDIGPLPAGAPSLSKGGADR